MNKAINGIKKQIAGGNGNAKAEEILLNIQTDLIRQLQKVTEDAKVRMRIEAARAYEEAITIVKRLKV